MIGKKYISIDLGNSTGRVYLGNFYGNKINLEEVYRFDNKPVLLHDTIYWNFLGLFSEMKAGIRKAIYLHNKEIESLSIDTWGSDFGLIGKDGRLLTNPISCRDKRTKGIIREISKNISMEDFFMISGEFIIEMMAAFQLYSMVKENSKILEITDKMLLLPDLFNYFLTNQKYSEFTNAITTQLFNQKSKEWSKYLINNLRIPFKIFTEIIYPGQLVGKTTKYIDNELDSNKLKIIACASHDASSSIAGLPILKSDINRSYAFLILGTWTAIGVEKKDTPIITKEAYINDFSNESFTADRIAFQKIISALWLIQECRNYWMKIENREIPWKEIDEYMVIAKDFTNFIDVDDSIFLDKSNNIIENITSYYQRTDQPLNMEKEAVSKTIYESLILKYKKAILDLEYLTGNKIEVLYLTGGGSKVNLLCQWIADALGIEVISGIPETTILGNLIMQMISSGEVKDIDDGREVIANSFHLSFFEPKEEEKWDEAFVRYQMFLEKIKNHKEC